MADFDEFDDFKFKPVTKGLGFHHEKKEVKNYKRQTPLETAQVREQTRFQEPLGMGKADLSAFYQTPPATVDIPTSLKQNATDALPEMAPLAMRFFAFLIDEVAVLFLTFVTLAGFALLLGEGREKILHQMPLLMTIPVSVAFYLLYFVTYFTVLDPQATIGKSVMHLKLVSTDGLDKVTFASSLTRSLICSLSPIVFFIPVFMGVQDKVSSTLVVKR